MLGYGAKLDEDYIRYLDGITAKVRGLDRLILCGGYTNPSVARSEAQVMGDYLRSRGVRITIHVEEASIDTIQNLRFASRGVAEGEEVVVFCDWPRRFKVYYMAKRLFSSGVAVKPVIRQQSFRKAWKQYLYKTPVEIVAFHWPWLHQQLLERRRKRWGLTGSR